MTNEEKSRNLAIKYATPKNKNREISVFQACNEMAQWKDKQFSEQNKWHKVADDKVGSPLQDYSGHDWVLCQFQDSRDGFLYMPHIAEWSRINNCWHTIESDNWESVYAVLGKCVAWCELPEYKEE